MPTNAGADRRAFLALLPAGALLSSWAQARGVEADPVFAAMTAHRRAYDVFEEWWDLTHGALYVDDEASKRRWYDIQNVEEAALNGLLATKPTTKAGAVACVAHVADYGPATNEMRAWLRCCWTRRWRLEVLGQVVPKPEGGFGRPFVC